MDHVDDSLPLAVFGWVSAVTIHPFVIARQHTDAQYN